MDVLTALKQSYPSEIAEKIEETFREIERNYFLGKWKASELDSGHFVEAVRRLIENELSGSYTPFNKNLSNFTDQVIKGYEQESGDESFRILVPRVLKAIYAIRNKRGVGHLSGFNPNKMDSTYILYASKWVLAEIIRLGATISTSDAQTLVDEVVERQIEFIWKNS